VLASDGDPTIADSPSATRSTGVACERTPLAYTTPASPDAP